MYVFMLLLFYEKYYVKNRKELDFYVLHYNNVGMVYFVHYVGTYLCRLSRKYLYQTVDSLLSYHIAII